jgi:hypothetical protein
VEYENFRAEISSIPVWNLSRLTHGLILAEKSRPHDAGCVRVRCSDLRPPLPFAHFSTDKDKYFVMILALPVHTRRTIPIFNSYFYSKPKQPANAT